MRFRPALVGLRRAQLLVACAALTALPALGLGQAATITDLGTDGIQLLSLSTHGHIASGVIGQSGAWRWTENTGATPMAGFVSSLGMNSYAQPIVGAYSPDNSPADAVAAMYYSNTPIIGMPDVIGGFPGTGGGTGQGISTPYGVSDTGVVVGLAYDPTNLPIAFSWSAAQGWTRLTVNRPNKYSRANSISRDGHVIVGWNDQQTGYRSGVIWRDGVPLDLTDASGNPVGEALAVSADGSVVVGYNYSTANGQEAWRWTAETGVVPLGVMAIAPAGPTKLAPRIKLAMQQQQNVPAEQRDVRMPGPDGFFPPTSYAFAVSADGQTIVGATGVPPTRKAVIWTDGGANMQLLSDYAAARGVTLPPTIPNGLASGNAISADGLTIGGIGFGASNYRSYIVDFHGDKHPFVQLTAAGTIGSNDLTAGPFAGVPAGTQVSMTFLISPTGTVIAPGQDTAYPVSVGSFTLRAGTAVDSLQPMQNGVNVHITNDYPKSDGIHLFSTPTRSGQVFEFELFNPGGNLFDSTDVNRVNRTFGPELFEKMAWDIQDGNHAMTIDLQSVTLKDARISISANH
jgi:hypothetical protein